MLAPSGLVQGSPDIMSDDWGLSALLGTMRKNLCSMLIKKSQTIPVVVRVIIS